MKWLGMLCSLFVLGLMVVWGFGIRVADARGDAVAPDATERVGAAEPSAQDFTLRPLGPDWVESDPEHAEDVANTSVASPSAPIAPLASIETVPVPPPVPVTPSVSPVQAPTSPPIEATQAVDLTPADLTAVDVTGPDASTSTSPAPIPASVVVPAQEQLYLFWQPFNTRGSAQGFARLLTDKTQLPIQVVEQDQVGGRHYRVALPYADEQQRQQRLTQLQQSVRLSIQ